MPPPVHAICLALPTVRGSPSIFNNVDNWFGFNANARAGQHWSRMPINAQRLAAALDGKTSRDQQQGKRWEVSGMWL